MSKSSPRLAPISALGHLAALALLAACSDSPRSSSSQSQLLATAPLPGSPSPAGPATAVQPPFLHDPNEGGTADALFIEELSFGRLVDVFDRDPQSGARRLVFRDFVVGPTVASDGVDYELDENLAGVSELTILHGRGSSAFRAALTAAEAARVPIADNAPPPGLPPWTAVGRDAAISIRFNDLLDASSVGSKTLRLATGYPAIEPFEARIIADRNHGSLADPDGDSVREFFPTRVILDLTVSTLDAARSSVPLAVNASGLPPAVTTGAPNVALRIPTRVAPGVGQTEILRNASGNGLSLAGNGTTDTSVPTDDVLRAFRSGGSEVGDAFAGMLADLRAPRVVGELRATLGGPILPDPTTKNGYLLPSLVFDVPGCASVLEQGDVIEQGGLIAVVERAGFQSGGLVQDLVVRVLHSAGAPPAAGAATAVSAFDPGADLADCFVTYAPTPTTAPGDGVSPQATARVRFSETMDIATLDGFYGITVSSAPAGPPRSAALVAGQVTPSLDLVAATFQPLNPLPHASGVSETWYLRVGGSPIAPPRDLAGNALADALDPAVFHVDAGAPSEETGSLVLRFESADMLGSDGFPELRGQFLLDLVQEKLRPRPVSRFESTIDRNNPLPGAMTAIAGGVQTPLSPLGSKLHQLWRHADIGFSLLDEANTNLDVEGLSWAPVGGAVISDAYDEFSIRLGHANQAPDEEIDAQSLFPMYPLSGIGTTFANNQLDTPEIVHPRERGYVVSPADLYSSPGGTILMPYPLNRDLPVEEHAYFTWRDTALQSLGGANGNGVPLDREITILGLGPEKAYLAGSVPSLGLPLLLELRCYPDNGAIGLNSLDVSIAANASPRPSFRAFSTGGFDINGQPQIVDPDLEDVASGGFNPTSVPPGQATPPTDNVSYLGSVSFVTTTSRVHSLWFDTQASAPNFTPAVVSGALPDGTEVRLHYRGADDILGGTPGQAGYIGDDAGGIDPYGDPRDDPATGSPSYPGGNDGWTADITDLDGLRYLQLRISFVGNPVTNDSADLGAIGLSWGG